MAKKSNSPRRSPSNHPHIEPVLALRATASADTYELIIYGDIGESWWGESVTAQSVAEQLNALDPGVANISVRINSYGGSVADGLAIYNALKRHKAKKAVTIDGVAMSSASLIAMAGDTITMPATSLLMIHAPWGGCAGNAKEMRQYADVLDKFSGSMADAYVKKSGKARSEILTLLTDGEDHYYTGEEAVEEGFADSVGEEDPDDDQPDESARGFAAALLERISARGVPAKYAGMAIAAAMRNVPTTPIPNASAAPESQPAAPASTMEITIMLTNEQKQALAARRNTIRSRFAPFLARGDIDQGRLAALQREIEDDTDLTPEQASSRLLEFIARETNPTPTAVRGERNEIIYGQPSGNDFVLAASDALLIRAGFRVEKPHAGARDILGMSISDIVQTCARRSGRSDVSNGASRNAVRAALSTSDFPAILSNTLGKALRMGYAAEPATFTAWTSFVTVADFKEQTRVLLGSAPDLEMVLEGAEYTQGSLDEDKSVPYKVRKYGRIIQLTWETLVNDDLGAFLRLTQAMGQAALRNEADLVYATFGENEGAGPIMQDGKALFHLDHGNLADSASTLDAAALGVGRILLRRQTAVGGGVMNLTPRFLLVSPEHEQAAEVLLAAAARALNQGSENALVPAWLAQLQLVVEARLDDSAAYLLTAPTSVDTLERAWLEEDGGPHIEEDSTFNVDAQSYKVRHVVGQRWLDWRGVVKLPIGA